VSMPMPEILEHDFHSGINILLRLFDFHIFHEISGTG
jgi:hypothetical protein